MGINVSDVARTFVRDTVTKTARDTTAKAMDKAASETTKKTAGSVDFFFASDSHDGYSLLDKFISQANTAKPDFVLNGGDLTENGTETEHRILNHKLSKLQVPETVLPGNHDYRGTEIGRFRREFGNQPRSFDYNGVHFVMFDNADQTISDSTFNFLEKDLRANAGKPTVVAMHVPVVGKAPTYMKKLNKLAPDTFAMPIVKDSAQVKRFTNMMSQHHVDLVLSGHTHVPDEQIISGVRYVTAGALGGQLLKPGTNHEYLHITLNNGKLDVQHVALDKPKNLARLAGFDTAYAAKQYKNMAAVHIRGENAAILDGSKSGFRNWFQQKTGQARVPFLKPLFKAFGAS